MQNKILDNDHRLLFAELQSGLKPSFSKERKKKKEGRKIGTLNDLNFCYSVYTSAFRKKGCTVKEERFPNMSLVTT